MFETTQMYKIFPGEGSHTHLQSKFLTTPLERPNLQIAAALLSIIYYL